MTKEKRHTDGQCQSIDSSEESGYNEETELHLGLLMLREL